MIQTIKDELQLGKDSEFYAENIKIEFNDDGFEIISLDIFDYEADRLTENVSLNDGQYKELEKIIENYIANAKKYGLEYTIWKSNTTTTETTTQFTVKKEWLLENLEEYQVIIEKWLRLKLTNIWGK